jgi:DNA-binding HxlR family transcriptional regulator
MNNQWYEIKDVDDFVKSSRILVFNNFGKNQSDEPVNMAIDNIKPEEQEEFNSILTQEESMVIAYTILRKQTHNTTKQIRYLINDSKFLEFIESLSDRMISNILNSLVNKGILDAAFDNEAEDFVFWIKNTNEDKEKPETD